MAPTLTTLTGPVSDVTRPYTTPSVTPSANGLVLLVVGITGNVTDTSARAAEDVSSTIGGLGPWQIVQQSNPGAVSKTAVYVWYAQAGASPTAGTITLAPAGGVSPADSELVVMQVTGHDTSAGPGGTVGAFSTITNPSLTLTAAPATGDLTINFSVSRNDSAGAIAGAGFTLDINAFHGNPSASTAVGHRTGSTSTTVPFDGLGTVHSSLLAFNLANSSGAAPASGSASGTIAWAGSATGSRVSAGLAAGAIAFAGIATGSTVHQGSASGAVAWSGAATGEHASQGAATGTLSWAGTASGTAPAVGGASGSASGTVSWAGAATGTAPVVGGASGSASGTLVWAGSAQGQAIHEGTASGSLVWAGSATGTAPTPGINQGSAAGTLTWTGSATGATDHAGTASGTIAWHGVAAGSMEANGTAAGTLLWSGTASGSAPNPDDGTPVPDPTLTVTPSASTLTLTAGASTLTLTGTPSRLELDVADFTTGDTAPALTGTVNASLVGATVEAHLRKPGGTVLTRAATVTDAASGAWSLSWAADDLDDDGVWAVEVQVTFSDETVQTFGPSTFRVRPQIA